MGGRADAPAPTAAARRRWCARSRRSRATPAASSSSPARRAARRSDRRALRHRDRRPRPAVGDLDAVDRAPPRRAAARAQERRRAGERGAAYDPGRERRAEQRARELLKSCVNEEEWAMYRDLGFLRVWGGQSDPDGPSELRGVDYAYLIYPHKPIVAYLPQTGRLLNEYCVEFPDETRPYGSPRLPDSDDVLAKWMALQGRRAPDHRRGEPAPARPPGRPAPDPARPLAARPLGARAARPRAARRRGASAGRAGRRIGPYPANLRPSWTATASIPSTSPAS